MNRVSEVLTDINRLRLAVGYLETRILRKQIMLQELMLGRDEDEPVETLLAPRAPVAEAPERLSVRKMVESILPGLVGKVFWYSDVKNLVLAKYATADGRLRKGIHSACHQMLNEQIIEKCTGGMRITIKT